MDVMINRHNEKEKSWNRGLLKSWYTFLGDTWNRCVQVFQQITHAYLQKLHVKKAYISALQKFIWVTDKLNRVETDLKGSNYFFGHRIQMLGQRKDFTFNRMAALPKSALAINPRRQFPALPAGTRTLQPYAERSMCVPRDPILYCGWYKNW